MEYQKGHIGTWLQSQAKLLNNVSTIGQNAKKILIISQSFKKILNLRSYSKNIFQPQANMLKRIPTLSQYAYAKLILSWDKLSWHEL
jgi:hypothetical protein